MSRRFISLNPKTRRTKVPNAGDCPDCYEKLDAASNPDGHQPSPGDPTVCAFCGCLLIFGADMELERMTDDQFEAFLPEVQAKLMHYHKTFRLVRNQMTRPDGPAVVVTKIPK